MPSASAGAKPDSVKRSLASTFTRRFALNRRSDALGANAQSPNQMGRPNASSANQALAAVPARGAASLLGVTISKLGPRPNAPRKPAPQAVAQPSSSSACHSVTPNAAFAP